MLNLFNKFFRQNSRQGQHISEYSLLIVCVMAGVLIGGPYVIRSWNALLKSYDTDIRDSFTDPLMQAPPEENGQCICDPNPSKGACGVTLQKVTCDPGFRMYYHTCNYLGCDMTPTCIKDDTCCPWADDQCGTITLPTTGEECGEFDMRQKKDCGGLVDWRCDHNNPKCLGCKGSFDPTTPWKQNMCPGANTNVPPPPPDTNWNAVGKGNCGIEKCQFECNYDNEYVPAQDLPGPPPKSTFCKCEGDAPEICSGTGADFSCSCSCAKTYDFRVDSGEKWLEDWLNKHSQWQGGSCPDGQIVIGIHTLNWSPDQGGHNDWWFACRTIDNSCFTGEESITVPQFVHACRHPELPNPIIMNCPPGQVVTGVESINSSLDNGPSEDSDDVPGGENWWRLYCKGVNKTCVSTEVYNGYAERFNEYAPKNVEVGQDSKTCFITGIGTYSVEDGHLSTGRRPDIGCDGGHNEWWVISQYQDPAAP